MSTELPFFDLQKQIQGEVRTDQISRWNYSSDASIYQLMPEAVIIPAVWEDVLATLTFMQQNQIPLTARGGGTSLGGQAIGHGLQLDLGKNFQKIIEINTEEAWVKVEPGVVLDHLNAALAPHGYWFGPDVAPSNRATLGGMIGNNSSGARSIVYGKTLDHVLELEVALADGTETTFCPTSPEMRRQKMQGKSLEAQIWQNLSHSLATQQTEIEARFPKIMRRVSGYNLDAFLNPDQDWNLADLVTGSEGTLALVRSAKLKISPKPAYRGLLVLYCKSLDQALESSHALLTTQPCASEVLDELLLRLTRENPAFAQKLSFMEYPAEVILLVEYQAGSERELLALLERGERQARSEIKGIEISRFCDPRVQADVWAIRKAGLPLLLSMPGKRKPVTFIEDTAVAPERLQAFIREFDKIVKAHQTEAAYYAHASVGCIHIRPLLNLQSGEDVAKMRSLSEQILDLVMHYGGAMSGEHGDGLARSEFNQKLFGSTVYSLFKSLKATWDPQNLLNPGKIVNAPPMDQNLRYGANYTPTPWQTVQRFSQQESFRAQIELCNGCGGCRKVSTGTMCPPYMVTRDERDSTRARANALRLLMLNPQLSQEDRAELRKTFALCLGCKACKAECPSKVDMAKLKLEFLDHWQKAKGVPWRSRLLSRLDWLNRLGSASAPLSNYLFKSPTVKNLLEKSLGLDSRRTFPIFSAQPLHTQWQPKRNKQTDTHGLVALFADCFTNYYHPHVGLAAASVIEALGYQISIPAPVCCGRPSLSLGLLDQAKAQARRFLDFHRVMMEAGIPLIGCEPSCILSFRDEYPDLWPEAKVLAQQSFSLQEWLLQVCSERKVLPFQAQSRSLAYHEHCHQKALVGAETSIQALNLIPGIQVDLLNTGCCGMAGTFGYEKENYELSCQIAEERLLPALRNLPETSEIVISGTSCWQQIAGLSERSPKHLAEVLAEALNPQP
ncbi:FAD-binding oxidoreductase [bacterium (Candidatus Blackallbacteria) CG17_big_fil_post_rev_8_21_14_2_50_48_46]|uniref:FAD-binding oxidoreductase n=1 Tax=bacterium (Candidatus Blackallbacteria) CG17_big_fil_post_rev_8_21_14_2_50_48_46 TaxID=2014261 RepID=A0A2M7G980_9BACT|nr:MAG: FAD-linked oxidase [bacterium (Candidatus Blackallbacteria) CG18_big_fil_WC_8_21_14_2_50_49_26]PIW18653.1 MAG: FAD-binding oxidoreductase [bacterium (Candidatus Blackallbacteria) CG17_big_fil_post_rev_8_21_14_2_50_48_46]PIW46361.1 MAG: FAD-binding oxidoreductase [bacterium (Candidatus Blackallbacteria) CG13_big_fil_rev_8_21_14_2_50_49_14]